jgi:hypothetical protein
MRQQDFVGKRKEHMQQPFKYTTSGLPTGWGHLLRLTDMRTPWGLLCLCYPHNSQVQTHTTQYTHHSPITPCFLNPDYSIKYKRWCWIWACVKVWWENLLWWMKLLNLLIWKKNFLVILSELTIQFNV